MHAHMHPLLLFGSPWDTLSVDTKETSGWYHLVQLLFQAWHQRGTVSHSFLNTTQKFWPPSQPTASPQCLKNLSAPHVSLPNFVCSAIGVTKWLLALPGSKANFLSRVGYFWEWSVCLSVCPSVLFKYQTVENTWSKGTLNYLCFTVSVKLRG